jgi:hypothetical protein
VTALSAVLDEKLLAFLLDVNSPIALAEQHIETLIGNAQHYERELFVRTLTVSALAQQSASVPRVACRLLRFHESCRGFVGMRGGNRRRDEVLRIVIACPTLFGDAEDLPARFQRDDGASSLEMVGSLRPCRHC